MEWYRERAIELFSVLDQKHKGPPHEEVSAVMRGEMAVLRLLSKEARSVTAGEICRMLRMKTPRMAAVLNALEKKGMILRGTDEADKRRVIVTLTPQGEAFCRERRAQAIDDVSKLLLGLGQEDAAHFVRIVRRLHELMPEGQNRDIEEKGEDADE